jgi:hypothetical protein
MWAAGDESRAPSQIDGANENRKNEQEQAA